MGKNFNKSIDRYLLGVCGGIADFFNINHWIIRILFVVVSIVSLIIPGLIVYLVLAAVMGPAKE
jgi:phage shock protein C